MNKAIIDLRDELKRSLADAKKAREESKNKSKSLRDFIEGQESALVHSLDRLDYYALQGCERAFRKEQQAKTKTTVEAVARLIVISNGQEHKTIVVDDSDGDYTSVQFDLKDSNGHMAMYDGEAKDSKEWAEKVGFTYSETTHTIRA